MFYTLNIYFCICGHDMLKFLELTYLKLRKINLTKENISFILAPFTWLFIFFFVVVFAILDLHVFPIPIPPPTSLPTPSLWVFPVHQPRALFSCIQPGLVICFTLENIHVSMLFSQNIHPRLLPESKSLFCTSVSFSVLHIGLLSPSF